MSVKIILLALETLLLFLFLVPLPVICSGNLLGIIVSVMLMLITANWTKFCGIISKIWGHGAGNENIQNSLKILDELGMSHDMTIVTDGFHQYRASLIAKAQGVENVTAYSAYTEPRYLFTYWVREWLGLTHFFMLGS